MKLKDIISSLVMVENYMQPPTKKPVINQKVVKKVEQNERAITRLARDIRTKVTPGTSAEKAFRRLSMILSLSFTYMKETGNTRVPDHYLKGYNNLREVVKAFKLLHTHVTKQ